MRVLVLAATTAASLILAAPAAAKELVAAELCGAAGCAAVDPDDLRLVPTGGETTTGPPPLGPYHVLRTTVAEGPEGGERHTWTSWYVPAAGLIVWPGDAEPASFHPVYGEAATFMKALAKTVAPFPAPRITAASVGGRRVSGDPGTYAELFAANGPFPLREPEGDSVPIELVSPAPSPWTNGSVTLSWWPESGVLLRGSQQLRLADGLADDVRSARALGTGGGTAVLPWLALAGLVAAIALLAGLGAVLGRRAAAPQPSTA